MSLIVKVFNATSPVTAHPSVVFTVPFGYKVVGGGAKDNWTGKGNLLTASYPSSDATWVVMGKDQVASSPASITAYVLAIYDPNDEWEVVVVSMTSDPSPAPKAVASVPSNYVLTGGGALVSYGAGSGNLLTASFPNPIGGNAWEARSKNHILSDSCSLTAYAIGIRSLTGKTVTSICRSAEGSVDPHPTAHVNLDPGYTLTGGGAFDEWSEPGNLLTASYPDGQGWTVAGKDHLQASPATITAYVIGIQTY